MKDWLKAIIELPGSRTQTLELATDKNSSASK